MNKMKNKYSVRIPAWIILSVIGLLFLWSCSEEVVSPPTIKVMVNGEEIMSELDTLFLANGTLLEYSFTIQASATIQEIYLVKYTAKLIKNPENLTEYIMTDPEGSMSYPVGLTSDLEEEVKGTLVYTVPAYEKYGHLSVMLVVSDVEGNETRRSFHLAEL